MKIKVKIIEASKVKALKPDELWCFKMELSGDIFKIIKDLPEEKILQIQNFIQEYERN